MKTFKASYLLWRQKTSWLFWAFSRKVLNRFKRSGKLLGWAVKSWSFFFQIWQKNGLTQKSAKGDRNNSIETSRFKHNGIIEPLIIISEASLNLFAKAPTNAFIKDFNEIPQSSKQNLNADENISIFSNMASSKKILFWK